MLRFSIRAAWQFHASKKLSKTVNWLILATLRRADRACILSIEKPWLATTAAQLSLSMNSILTILISVLKGVRDEVWCGHHHLSFFRTSPAQQHRIIADYQYPEGLPGQYDPE
jgi:hypothetical protein